MVRTVSALHHSPSDDGVLGESSHILVRHLCHILMLGPNFASYQVALTSPNRFACTIIKTHTPRSVSAHPSRMSLTSQRDFLRVPTKLLHIVPQPFYRSPGVEQAKVLCLSRLGNLGRVRVTEERQAVSKVCEHDSLRRRFVITSSVDLTQSFCPCRGLLLLRGMTRQL
jgi:hypothetical protein